MIIILLIKAKFWIDSHFEIQNCPENAFEKRKKENNNNNKEKKTENRKQTSKQTNKKRSFQFCSLGHRKTRFTFCSCVWHIFKYFYKAKYIDFVRNLELNISSLKYRKSQIIRKYLRKLQYKVYNTGMYQCQVESVVEELVIEEPIELHTK